MRAFRLDLDGVGVDVDFFRDGADGKGDIDVLLIVHFDIDVRDDRLTKALRVHRELIGAGSEGEETIGTVSTRNGLLLGVGLHIDDGDLRAGDDALRAVSHGSENRASDVRARYSRVSKHY